MNQTYTNHNSTNAMGHLNMVENLMRQAEHDLQQYHKLIQLFRQDLQHMNKKIQNADNEIQETTIPLIQALYGNLQNAIQNQRDDNNNFQQQLTQLKKQKAVLGQMIAATSKRQKQLQQQVGQYS